MDNGPPYMPRRIGSHRAGTFSCLPGIGGTNFTSSNQTTVPDQSYQRLQQPTRSTMAGFEFLLWRHDWSSLPRILKPQNYLPQTNLAAALS